MKSMTGYGYAERQNENYILSVELKSYNNRYLEISHFTPGVLNVFENAIDERIKKVCERGHVDVFVKLKTLKGNVQVSVDENAVLAYLEAFDKIKKLSGGDLETSMGDIASLEGVLTAIKAEDASYYEETFFACLDEAIVPFAESKNREGEVTKKDLIRLASSLSDSLSVVKNNVEGLEAMIKTNLLARFDEMLGDKNYDQNRFLTEVAVMLVRYSINEETVRLGAHIDELFKLLNGNSAVGKKLDFLCQEMNREINTIGSKSQMVEINLEVVNMKDCLENIREQIRNIE